MREATCIGNGQAHMASHITKELCQTLNTMHDQMAVMITEGEEMTVINNHFSNTRVMDTEVSPTVDTVSNRGGGLIGVMTEKSIVRRLTPLECERLQGFPDGWTKIGEEEVVTVNDYKTVWEQTHDSREPTKEEWENDDDLYDDDGLVDLSKYGYKKKRVKVGEHQETVYTWFDSTGKKRKTTDSARYKALGNSIALPFWEWMARRICDQYDRPVTMGSLFDGIGGFPLAFTRAGAEAVFASEIEELPIAVTRKRFPDDSEMKDETTI